MILGRESGGGRMAGLWFDRPTIRPPEARPDDARLARAKRERIKFRLVQT